MPEGPSDQLSVNPDSPQIPWRRVGLWSTLSVVSAIALALILVFNSDLGVFKSRIESWVSNKTGRTLVIDGPLVIELGRDGLVFAEQVRLANPDWADNEQMLDIDSLQVRFDFWTLLGSRPVIDSVDIGPARIHLQRNANNAANWQFGSPTADASESSGGIDILLKELNVADVSIVHSVPDIAEPREFVIESLVQTRDDNDRLNLALAGSAGGRRIELDGHIDTWGKLLAGSDVSFDLDGALDTVELSVEGRIDNVAAPSRPTLEFSLVGPDIDDLARLFGLSDEANGDIDIRGSLVPAVDGPLTLALLGNIGETELEANGRFSDLANVTEMDLDILASGPSLGRMLRWFGQSNLRDAPYMIDINASRQGNVLIVEQADMVFGEAQLSMTANLPNFPGMDDATIDLDVTGPDIERLRYLLRLPGVAKGPFSAALDLTVSPLGREEFALRAETSLGRVEASGSLGNAPDYFGSTVDVDFTAANLADFGDALGIENLPNRPLEIRGGVEYSADGLRTVTPLVASINEVIATVEGLVVPDVGLVGTDAALTLTGPDLAVLVQSFGSAGSVPPEPYVFESDVIVEADGFRFRDASGSIGRSQFDLQGLLSSRDGLAGTSIEISVRGPAFEEVLAGIGKMQVTPGPYALSGGIELGGETLAFRNVDLKRDNGELRGNITLGLPMPAGRSSFDIQGSGADIRNLLKGGGRFAVSEAPFRLDAAGEWQGVDWSIDRFTLSIGDAEMTAGGQLRLDSEAASSEFRISGNVPSLASLGTLDGHRLRDQSLSWEGSVADADDQLEFDLLVRLAESDIDGKVVYRAGDVPGIDIDVQATSIVVSPLLEEYEREYDPEPEFADGRLIPDVAVPFDLMRSFNATLNLDVTDFRRDTLHMRNIGIGATLQDGAFAVSRFGFDGRAGRFDARFDLTPTELGAEVNAGIIARDFAFGASKMNQDLEMIGDLDVNLSATGSNVRELAGNANGVLLINTRGGRIVNNRFMQAMFGDVLDEIIGTINPFFKREEFTKLDCVVLPYRVDEGVVTSDPNVFISTDKIHIASDGEIDLKTEKIDVNIRTTPKKSLGISAGELVNPYIKLVGTLSKPRLAVDETGVLVSGGAAVATGGLSILARAAWSRLSRAEDPCADTAERSIEALRDRFPDWGPADTVESAP